MIVSEISRFMDKNVHISAYYSLFRSMWMSTMIWHFWQQCANKLPYVWQWSSKISWQRRNAPM